MLTQEQQDSLRDFAESEQGKEIKAIMEKLSRLVNNFGFNNKEAALYVCDLFFREHRTLQQSMIRFLVDTLKRAAEFYKENPSAYYDDRNKQAMDWIATVARLEAYFPLI